MSIESNYGFHIPVCDGCGAELPEECDFYDAVNAKKANDWHSIKEEWGWQDYCPDCWLDQVFEV